MSTNNFQVPWAPSREEAAARGNFVRTEEEQAAWDAEIARRQNADAPVTDGPTFPTYDPETTAFVKNPELRERMDDQGKEALASGPEYVFAMPDDEYPEAELFIEQEDGSYAYEGSMEAKMGEAKQAAVTKARKKDGAMVPEYLLRKDPGEMHAAVEEAEMAATGRSVQDMIPPPERIAYTTTQEALGVARTLQQRYEYAAQERNKAEMVKYYKEALAWHEQVMKPNKLDQLLEQGVQANRKLGRTEDADRLLRMTISGYRAVGMQAANVDIMDLMDTRTAEGIQANHPSFPKPVINLLSRLYAGEIAPDDLDMPRANHYAKIMASNANDDNLALRKINAYDAIERSLWHLAPKGIDGTVVGLQASALADRFVDIAGVDPGDMHRGMKKLYDIFLPATTAARTPAEGESYDSASAQNPAEEQAFRQAVAVYENVLTRAPDSVSSVNKFLEGGYGIEGSSLNKKGTAMEIASGLVALAPKLHKLELAASKLSPAHNDATLKTQQEILKHMVVLAAQDTTLITATPESRQEADLFLSQVQGAHSSVKAAMLNNGDDLPDALLYSYVGLTAATTKQSPAQVQSDLAYKVLGQAAGDDYSDALALDKAATATGKRTAYGALITKTFDSDDIYTTIRTRDIGETAQAPAASNAIAFDAALKVVKRKEMGVATDAELGVGAREQVATLLGGYEDPDKPGEFIFVDFEQRAKFKEMDKWYKKYFSLDPKSSMQVRPFADSWLFRAADSNVFHQFYVLAGEGREGLAEVKNTRILESSLKLGETTLEAKFLFDGLDDPLLLARDARGAFERSVRRGVYHYDPEQGTFVRNPAVDPKSFRGNAAVASLKTTVPAKISAVPGGEKTFVYPIDMATPLGRVLAAESMQWEPVFGSADSPEVQWGDFVRQTEAKVDAVTKGFEAERRMSKYKAALKRGARELMEQAPEDGVVGVGGNPGTWLNNTQYALSAMGVQGTEGTIETVTRGLDRQYANELEAMRERRRMILEMDKLARNAKKDEEKIRMSAISAAIRATPTDELLSMDLVEEFLHFTKTGSLTSQEAGE